MAAEPLRAGPARFLEHAETRARGGLARSALRYAGVLRASEWLLIAYFTVAGVRAAFRGLYVVAALDACVPLVFAALEFIDRRLRRSWIDIARDWIPMALLLLAYWNVDFFAVPRSNYAFELRWIRIDKLLLNDWRGRAMIECCGLALPFILEFLYLSLYAVPPLLLGAVYALGGRRRVDRFLFTLFAGTLLSYTLLPLFPSASPYLVFARQDLPSTITFFRRINLLVLNSLDIRASVFPSGHVTVAFSSAFACMAALPERRFLGRLLLVFATLVAVATVYARYHFAVDAAAGFAIALFGFAISRTALHALSSCRADSRSRAADGRHLGRENARLDAREALG